MEKYGSESGTPAGKITILDCGIIKPDGTKPWFFKYLIVNIFKEILFY